MKKAERIKVCEEICIDLVIFRLRAKGHLGNLVLPAILTLVEPHPKGFLEKNCQLCFAHRDSSLQMLGKERTTKEAGY